ncbi:hypothetical protein ABPG74_016041 [Tetrahymena malaccensis]
MKMNDGSPLKVTKLKRCSANNFTQENQQISVCQNINQKHQMMAQTIIEKIRCNSENLQSKQKRQTSSYAEQLAQYSLKNIIQQQMYIQKNSNNAELSPTKQQNTSSCLNDSLVKKNNKRVIISALKLSIELGKKIEEEIEQVECETIVNEEFKRYKNMRTDSFSYNDHLVKEEIIKQLQATKKSGSLSPLRRQSNVLNTLQGQREIKSLQASRQLKEYLKQQLTQSQIQEDYLQNIKNLDNSNEKQSPQFIQRSSFQKALNDLEEEIGQLNKNCRKRYERSRISNNSSNNQEAGYLNTQSLSSEEGQQDNSETRIKTEQINSSTQQQKISEKDDICFQYQNQDNQIDNLDQKGDSKEKCSPLWRRKICYSQKNQINNTRMNADLQQYKIQKERESSGNFAIFKNQFIKQMQSNVSEKKNFATNDSSYYMADADTDSSKQSSALSTKKNSCESEEIISANKDQQFAFNNNSLIFSQSQEIVDQQIITPKKQYCVQKLQDQLDISNKNQQNQITSKNSSNPPFQFGFNGFLSQQIYEKEGKNQNTQEENKSQLRGRSLTPFKSSKINPQDQGSIIINQNKLQEINLADQTIIELNQASNQLNKQDKNNKSGLNQNNTQQYLQGSKSQFQQVKQKQATLEQIIMNEPRIKTESSIQRHRKRNLSAKEHSNSYTQSNEGQNDLNDFRKKLLHKVMKNNIENKLSNQQQIGDSNNNIFQIRRIANQKQKSEYENQSSIINNNFLSNNYMQQTCQNMKLNVLNLENKDLKQKNDNKNISANIQAHQEKLNNILKKKYKHTNSKNNKNNVSLQNQILQDCHSKIFSAEDDISFFLKKLGTSPTVSKINEKESNQKDLNKSTFV